MTLPNFLESDHRPIITTISTNITSKTPPAKQIWLYKHANYPEMNNEILDKTQGLDNTVSVDESANTLTNVISEAMTHHIPHKNIRIRNNSKPWFTNRLRILFKNCHKLHRRKTKYPTERNIQLYHSSN